MQQNQECIPNVLAVFLGDSGIGHPDEVIQRLHYHGAPHDFASCFQRQRADPEG